MFPLSTIIKAPQTAQRALTAPVRAARRFMRDEDGAILPFSLIIFLAMLMAGGLAVDVMRQERARVLLQNTLDRAVLAAADLDQTRDPKTVVLDYFAAAKLSNFIDPDDVIVDQGLNFKTVRATASATIPTFFLNMVNIDTLTAPASSTAEERIQNVEISLVVDISGSMGGSRMSNLKTAANDFIDTVISATPPTQDQATGVTSLSIIPYQGMVNIGDDLGREFNLSNHHNYSQCVVFNRNDYNSTGLSSTQVLDRMAHFDKDTSGSNSPIRSPNCPVADDEAIITHSVSRNDLKSKIAALSAGGWTAIDVGLKWGVALVDPAARPVINGLEDDGIIHEELRDRPADYSDRETLKVVVLMTDGSNTNQYDLKSEFKSGMSDIWVHTENNGTKRYSGYIPRLNQYYIPHRNRYENNPHGGSSAQRMSNADLFATFSVRYIADRFYRNRDNAQYNRYRYASEQISWQSRADERALALCNASRTAGIVIFTIGFEAPSGGQNLMRACASSASHYFDVSGVEISEAFSAIARTINQLRLTQ